MKWVQRIASMGVTKKVQYWSETLRGKTKNNVFFFVNSHCI
jgi:hypothetical protein